MIELEKKLRNKFSKFWSGWISWHEPRGNAGIGFPDLMVIVDNDLIPIELKLGSLVTGLLLTIPKMRPDQISWHHSFYQTGLRSFWLIQTPTGNLVFCRKILGVDPGKNYMFDKTYMIDCDGDIQQQLTDKIREWKKL